MTSRRTRYKDHVDGVTAGEGQSAGAAPFPDREAHLRIREDSLPRATEESPAAVPQLRIGQPVSAICAANIWPLAGRSISQPRKPRAAEEFDLSIRVYPHLLRPPSLDTAVQPDFRNLAQTFPSRLQQQRMSECGRA
jgi:hypothetical protein